jgi:hypothetical protein
MPRVRNEKRVPVGHTNGVVVESGLPVDTALRLVSVVTLVVHYGWLQSRDRGSASLRCNGDMPLCGRGVEEPDTTVLAVR